MLLFPGAMLVFFSGRFREPGQEELGRRTLSRQARPTVMSPQVVSGDQFAGRAPQVGKSWPEIELNKAGETRPETVRPETDRSFRVPAQIADPVRRQKLKLIMEKYARRYGVDEGLVWAVIRQKSGFNPQAVSPAYNAGPETVVKCQGCPPFPETRNYIASILQAYAGGSIREDWQTGLKPGQGRRCSRTLRSQGVMLENTPAPLENCITAL
jgi:soluble lytic murein transglycosylase-like protein